MSWRIPLVVAALVAPLLVAPTPAASTTAPSAAASVSALSPAVAARSVWPREGQAAYVLARGAVKASPHRHRAPIASMAKAMTAYLVLRSRPLAHGFTMRVHGRDVRDWHRRVARGESTVPVRSGERLTERQALLALLLPSANNIAIMLARRVSGTVGRFVALMNRTASRLHMRHTNYTDPSGFKASTSSTPVDQLALARAASRLRTFRHLVSTRRAHLPVAGWIHNTDTLLGRDGFVGIKTGSMDASGGCFMFRSRRVVHGAVVTMYGVVMGQRGSDLIGAGLSAAHRLVDRVAPKPAF